MKTSITLITVGMLLLTMFTIIPAYSQAESDVTVIVCFEEKPDERVIRSHGGKVVQRFDLIPAMTVQLRERSIRRLAMNEKVAYVERDTKVQVLEDPVESLPWGVDRIDADLVHPSNTGAGINIAVIDTGIDYTHPDLKNNYKGGYDYVNGDTDPKDDHGHGTHVAGTIAAVDNEIGVIGVAPDANLYAIKALDSTGSGYISDIIYGINWATQEGMDIITMSLGSDSDSQALNDAVDAAYRDGVLIIAAAGNDGNPKAIGDSINFPAAYSSVIAVTATDSDDIRADWSSTGLSAELAAPGVGILSTARGGTYAYGSGTSMAAPHVAGVAALIMESDSSLTNAEVRARLQDTAIDLGKKGKDKLYGFGLVDADEAVGGSSGTTGTLYVKSTDMSSTAQGANLYIHATVTVVDLDGSGVDGATVSLVFELPGGATVTATGTTGSDGSVVITYGRTKTRGTYGATVTDVVKTGWTHDETRDLITTGSITV